MKDFLRSYQTHRARVSNDSTRSQATSKDLTTRLSVSTMLDETTRSQVSSDVPEHSGGVITNVRKYCVSLTIGLRTRVRDVFFAQIVV